MRASINYNNIREGFARYKAKDFAHFHDFAKGSTVEVLSMIYAAENVGILGSFSAESLRNQCEILLNRIALFQKHLR